MSTYQHDRRIVPARARGRHRVPDGTVDRSGGPSTMRRFGVFARRWLVFVACVLLWQWTATIAASVYFPSPLTIARTIGHLWFTGPAGHLFLGPGFQRDFAPSVTRLLEGWGIAVVAGVVIGLALGLVPVLADLFGPVLAFLRALPPVMLVPVFFVLFKIGGPMEVATIVSGSVWPVLLNAVDGARSVDPTKVDTGRAFRIGRARWVGTVVLPAAAPKIFAGLRVSLAIALILMVVSELAGSTEGLGYQILSAEQDFKYPIMWAGIVTIATIGYVLNRLLVLIERRTLSWQPSSEG